MVWVSGGKSFKEFLGRHPLYTPFCALQLSMRVLELALCTLLAVIVTTPLRSDHPQGQVGARNEKRRLKDNCSTPLSFQYGIHGNHPLMPPRRRNALSLTSCLNCCKDSPPMIEFEDEIYSEICANNHTNRQMQSDPSDPYTGTLAGIGVGGGGLIPMGTLSAPHHYQHYHHHHHAGGPPPSSTTSHQNLLLYSSNMMHAAQGGSIHHARSSGAAAAVEYASSPSSTLRAACGGDGGDRGASTLNAATESAIYSNVANGSGGGGSSRPSSMLYNEAGFVRFRMGGDPGRMVDEVLRQSTDDVTKEGGGPVVVEHSFSRRGMGLEGLRASQSFDESASAFDQTSSR